MPTERSALLQQLQQLQPADGGKADAVDDEALFALDERHVVPGFHLRHDRRKVSSSSSRRNSSARSENTTPKPKVASGAILFDDGDVGAGCAGA